MTTVRRTRRWRGVVAVVLVALAVGVLAKRPSLLLVAATGIVFAAYPEITTPPTVDLSVEREMTPESPGVGDVVTVTTTLRNEGSETLPDVRFVDGVPPMLSVVDGSPRAGTALRPAAETTIEYDVRADQGIHRFGPATVIARDVSGATEVETTVATETVIECGARIPAVPLRAQSRNRTGQLVTDRGGSGLEFHRVTEYERGDPVGRIDWRRFARTRELTTVEFREERLAEVVLCVDARATAYRAASPDDPHAVAYAVDAAGRIAETLFAADHRVGLATLGSEPCWLPAGSGPNHEARFRTHLSTHPSLSMRPPEPTGTASAVDDPDRRLSTLRERLGGGVQVFLVTPLCDDGSTRAARTLEESGCAVTVVSPDVTADSTTGGRLARIERENRLRTLRSAGIPAVDWHTTDRLGTALAAIERWDP
ncbi:DUF58 domain-containing protein [Halorubrum sp. DTA98]|uniref:DUF58 domain-containing protein n=1 Tax=Halorubrum sp. DTA98 TaxID=3402163 RepID=UPI003AAE829F